MVGFSTRMLLPFAPLLALAGAPGIPDNAEIVGDQEVLSVLQEAEDASNPVYFKRTPGIHHVAKVENTGIRHAVSKARVPAGIAKGGAHRHSHFVARRKAHAGQSLDGMLEEMRTLRDELKDKAKTGGWDDKMDKMESQLAELNQMLVALDRQEAKHVTVQVSHADLQAEIDRLRVAVDRVTASDEGVEPHDVAEDESKLHHEDEDHHEEGEMVGRSVASKPSHAEEEEEEVDHRGDRGGHGVNAGGSIKTASSSGSEVDKDMEMPYGDLAPFGREDTAKELTEDSLRQSDAMVDQMERAEVAEEKRSVFRALTRLRGAAITSYDGIARSQTGNIDEYARTNQWRKVHPVRHLAQEENDVKRWAFPESTD